jgi:hypothetical protein
MCVGMNGDIAQPGEHCASTSNRNFVGRHAPRSPAIRVRGPVGVNDGFATDHFDVDPFRKELLLAGQDDISFTLSQSEAIDDFEARYRSAMPWV